MSRNVLRSVCVDLPEHIVSMLEELSKLLGASPSRLLINILHPIYEVWRVAREVEARFSVATSTTTNVTSSTSTRSVDANGSVSVDAVVEGFAGRYSGEWEKRFVKRVVEGFLMWLSSKGIDVCSALATHAEQYVNEVLSARYSQSRLRKAGSCLRSFLAYAKPRLCRSRA